MAGGLRRRWPHVAAALVVCTGLVPWGGSRPARADEPTLVGRGPARPVVRWAPDPGAAPLARMTHGEVMARVAVSLPVADAGSVIGPPEVGRLDDDAGTRSADLLWRVEARNGLVTRRHRDSTAAYGKRSA
jgi:hypothetical protein